MLNKSKLVLYSIAVIGALATASPVFAQSFSAGWGTGNAQPSAYDHEGRLHAEIPGLQQNQVATDRNGLNAFASEPRGATGIDSPADTGGGSAGYNENLRTNY